MLRLFFTKTGEAAYISHLDLQRVMARALRRSGLPVWYSQGFNPHIYMSFALPLSLMQESLCETVDCKTESDLEDFSAFIAPLNAALPRGIRAQKIAFPVHGAGDIAKAEYHIEYPGREKEAENALLKYEQLPTAPALHKKKRSEETIDLKQIVENVQPAEAGGFTAVFPAGSTHNVNPALLTVFLQGFCGLPAAGAKITRKRVFTADNQPFA